MKRLKGSSSAASMDAKSLLAEADLLKARCDMFQTSIAALMHFLKAFALDVAEIRSDRFKEQIQQLAERFQEAEKPKRLALEFEDEKEKILNFIECQQTYIKDRETELRDIIDLLTKAMANLNVENREFYQRINEQSEKIIEISHLDDIKRIKNALKLEVDQMREIVNLKQDQEHRQIRLLAGQVQSLQSELEQARSKAMTDGLTGIYNRQALNDYLAERIERNQVMNSDLSLMMIDIDDFKKINDKYGHLIGDRVLMAVAQKCKNAIRGDDFLARYGGEEFTIVLECAVFRNALKKARQICTTIASVRYAIGENQTSDYLSVTVSIGVTQLKKNDSVADLIARADKALYDAKQKGKNCAVGRKS